MGFSPLADMSRRIPHGNRQSPRNSRITGFTIHHQAGVNTHGEATNPARVVSANYWITNEGDILPNVDESMRAWTTGAEGFPAGAASDHRNITVEVSNSPEGVKNKTWEISDAAMNALVRLISDVFKRHNLGNVRRGLYSGVAVHQDFVPTACPGPYIMSHLNDIIEKANQGEDEMTPEDRKLLTQVANDVEWLKSRTGGSFDSQSITSMLRWVMVRTGGTEGSENITNRLRTIEKEIQELEKELGEVK